MTTRNYLLNTPLCALLTLSALCVGCSKSDSDSDNHEEEKTPSKVTVFEFTPAPGQYINSGYTASTPDEAATYAETNLNKNRLVSLGAWGGYLVVGFEQSIQNVEGSRDLWIGGNAYATSNEPAVVWVMQDTNSDGKPNDTWYEVKGSEYGKAETIQNYAVTYHKAVAGESIRWENNQGESGTIDPNPFHSQPYYPAWIATDSYTLTGTRLSPKTVDNSTSDSEYWENKPFDWGYADNAGSDYVKSGTEIELDNAINLDGTPANLEYIDFVKVQAAVNTKAGWLGEISPEITGFKDLNL